MKDIKLDAEGQRSSDEELTWVRQDAEARRTALEQWCITSYGEAFSSWIHVCAVRLFVESILRYGLPPQVGREGGQGVHVGVWAARDKWGKAGGGGLSGADRACEAGPRGGGQPG